MTTQKVPVTLINGYSAWKGLLGLIAFPDMLRSDYSFCRFFTFIDEHWGHKDFNFDCKSITYLIRSENNYKAWWLLGKNGEIVEIKSGVPKIDRIPGAGLGFEKSYGYVNTIKNISGELYVCGYRRQVYKREPEGWTSISDDIRTRESGRGFFDIDGMNDKHLYAVGWHGEIYFYDGQKWYKDTSPTDAHLASIRCLSPDNVWICGNRGIVLHGYFNNWDILKDNDINGNWYCIEEHEGRMYLAGNNFLAYIDKDSIIKIDTGLNKPITTNRLHSREGLLWSIGEKDILVFDGSSWKEIIHPDNA